MRHRTSPGFASACALVVVFVWWGSEFHPMWASADPPAPPEGGTVDMEVAVVQKIVWGDGRVAYELPPSRYQLRETPAGQTIVTIGAAGAHADRRGDPFAAFTAEYGPQASPRLLDPAGLVLSSRGGATASPSALPRDLGTTIVQRQGALQRRRTITRALGTSVGRVRGLERFVRREGDATRELLVSPDDAVPIELNVVRRQRLELHARFVYEPRAGALVRRSTVSEIPVPGRDDQRLVSTSVVERIALEPTR